MSLETITPRPVMDDTHSVPDVAGVVPDGSRRSFVLGNLQYKLH